MATQPLNQYTLEQYLEIEDTLDYRSEFHNGSVRIDNPMVLVGVTSPSTKDYDYGTRREHYFSLSSVQHYLLVSQTDRTVGHYERSSAAWLYIDRRSAIIFLGQIEIPVGEIYAGILP